MERDVAIPPDDRASSWARIDAMSSEESSSSERGGVWWWLGRSMMLSTKGAGAGSFCDVDVNG